jgi:hypothetical protein
LKSIEFNDAFMGSGDPLKGSTIPGFGAGNRTASTPRVGRNRAKAAPLKPVKKAKAPLKPVKKGLARCAVSVKSIGDRTFEVRVKGTLHILGHIRSSQGAKGKAYSYRIIGEASHNGFASQKAAVDRMLEKC